MEMETKRSELNGMKAAMDIEYFTFEPQYKDLADYVLPRRPQFVLTDVNKGDRRNLKIVNTTPVQASRTQRSGMMGGITSPARPWFRLGLADRDLMEVEAVQQWLHVVTERLKAIFLRSNLYNALPIIYGDLGTFGTAALFVEEDFGSDMVRFYPFPIGSYRIATNDKLKVDVWLREFKLTVRQLVKKFGIDRETGKIDWTKFSDTVKDAWDRKNFDTWIEVIHIIQPNAKYNPKGLVSKPYESFYYEKGNEQNNSTSNSDLPEIYLREGGYDRFPVLCTRWEVSGEDVYSTDCPGMTAIGDIKALMTLEKRKAQAIEKMINPPMTGPSALKKGGASILPGDMTYDDSQNAKGFRPSHEVSINLQHLSDEITRHEDRINNAYFVNLFLMLANSDRRQITATEVEERHEEKLLALGPVLEQLNTDLLDPLIDITFDIAAKRGLLPEPPEELQGADLKVEYISIMHAAQKMAGLAGLERVSQFAAEMSAVAPDVMDKLNTDQMMDEYGDIVGVPPEIIRSDEEVEQMRAVRAEQQQAQNEADAMQQGASTLKDLGGANLDNENALAALTKQSQAGAI